MYHTNAVILKKEEWNEADWRVTVLSKDFGKIRLLAQGARKHGAKLQGHLEIGSLSDISFVIGRNGYRLTTARVRSSFPRLRLSLSKLCVSAEILGNLEQNLWEEGESAAGVFGMAVQALDALDQAERLGTVRRIAVWFHVAFLKRLGFLPAEDSPEGLAVPSLIAFSRQPFGALGATAIDDSLLLQELRWLLKRVDLRLQLPVAVSERDLGLYW